MSGKLILHIGPPKTATTGLQYALQNGIPGIFIYGGITQPRSDRVEISGILHDYCMRRIDSSSAVLSEAKASIKCILDSGQDLLISEEMFLVDSQWITHQQKIEKLADVLGDFKVRVILCARNPVDGLPSLYQEIYRELPLRQKLSFKAFVKGNQASVFDYIRVVSTLKDNGFSDIQIISFDSLVSGEVDYGDIFDKNQYSGNKILIKKVNTGKYKESVYVRQFDPLVLDDFIRISTISKIVPRKLKKRPGFISAINRISGIKLTGIREKKLILDDESLARFDSNYKAILDLNN